MNMPKRRKSKYNPYTISFDGKYFVSFIDGMGVLQKVEVSSEVYETMNGFELEDLSFLNEFDRHIEHIEQTEESIYHKTVKEEVLEDIIIKKIEKEQVYQNIEKLDDIQKRRIKKYFFEGKTLKEISIEESCSIRAVKYSIDIGIEKLKKFQN